MTRKRPSDVGQPLLAKVRKFGPGYVELLVIVTVGLDAPVGDALRAARQMRSMGEAFVQEFGSDHVKAVTHGPMDNLRSEGLVVHMWLRLEHHRRPASEPHRFDDGTRELLASFFWMHDIDVVHRSFPRRAS